MYRFACLLIFLIFTTPALAETRYISDELRVPLRKSPCSRCTIIHRGLKSGLKLNVLETEDGWSHITTPGGLDGWLESQYLIKQPIARNQIAKFRQQNESMKSRTAQMSSSLATAQQEAKGLTDQLALLQGESRDTAAKLKEVREVSSNALKLHTQNQELLKQNKMLQSEIDILKATSEQLASSNTQKWFFYGSLSVFMGALLSIFLPHLKRKRRGYSEWG